MISPSFLVKFFHSKCFLGSLKSSQGAECDNIDDVMEDRKKTKNPRIIVCPACSKKGRVNYSHPGIRW
jgi:hypothetical protein